MVVTLGTVTMSGKVGTVTIQLDKEDKEKIANLDKFPMPASDEDATEVFDYGGVEGLIKLEGAATGKTLADLKTWAVSLDALENGSQTSIVYKPQSLHGGNYNVFVERVHTWYTKESDQIVYFAVDLAICAASS